MTKSSTFQERIIRGASLTVVSQGFSMAVRFVSNLILARLLLPDSFGLMAIVNILIMGLFLLSETGIGANIIRHSRGDDPDFCNTMWTVQVIRGIILSLVCFIVAKPLALFYQQDKLETVLSVMTIYVLTEGLQSTSFKVFERKLQLKPVIIITVTTQLISVITMITWTYISPTVWGLVAGSIVGSIYKALLSHVINQKQPNRFRWEKETIKEATHFGKWIFISTAFSFLATQSDRILIGKLITIETLGVYHIALALVQIPFLTMAHLSVKIIYPMFSNYNREKPDQLNQKLAKIKGVMLPCVIVILTTVMVFEEPFYKILYKEVYHDAIWIIPFLLIKIWFDILILVGTKLPLAVGRTEILAYVSLMNFITKTLFCLVGFYFWELRGFLTGQIAGAFVTYIFLVIQLKKINIKATFADIKNTLILLLLIGGVNFLYSLEILTRNYLNTMCSVAVLSIITFLVVKRTLKGIKSETFNAPLT